MAEDDVEMIVTQILIGDVVRANTPVQADVLALRAYTSDYDTAIEVLTRVYKLVVPNVAMHELEVDFRRMWKRGTWLP